MTDKMTLRALRRAATGSLCLIKGDLCWMEVIWKDVHYVWTQLESLYVLSSAWTSTDWSRVCGWLVCLGRPLSSWHKWWHCFDGFNVLYFLLFLIVVPSYLLVHSICTKKLDWWAAVCFGGEWNSLSAVMWLAYVLLRYTKNICSNICCL